MLPFGVTIPATVPQRSEITEGLMNYSVYVTSHNIYYYSKIGPFFMTLYYSGD